MKKHSYYQDEHTEINPGHVIVALVAIVISLIISLVCLYFVIITIGWWLPIAIMVGVILWSCYVVVRDFIL